MKNQQFPVEMTVEYALEDGIQTIERYEYTSYSPYIRATPDIFEVHLLYYLFLNVTELYSFFFLIILDSQRRLLWG